MGASPTAAGGGAERRPSGQFGSVQCRSFVAMHLPWQRVRFCSRTEFLAAMYTRIFFNSDWWYMEPMSAEGLRGAQALPSLSVPASNTESPRSCRKGRTLWPVTVAANSHCPGPWPKPASELPRGKPARQQPAQRSLGASVAVPEVWCSALQSDSLCQPSSHPLKAHV